jgi:hypothetical protein
VTETLVARRAQASLDKKPKSGRAAMAAARGKGKGWIPARRTHNLFEAKITKSSNIKL